MQRRIQELETERAAQQSKLSEQLQTAAQSDQKIIESTQALLGSLHSTTARGHWGEVQLRRIVEAAGMLPHVDFTEQHSVRTADGAALRPDMVVHLPGQRHLIIDARHLWTPQILRLRPRLCVSTSTHSPRRATPTPWSTPPM